MPLLLIREARPVKKPAKQDDGGTVSDDKPTNTSSPDTASPALSSSKATAAPSTTSTSATQEADEKDVKYFWRKTEVSPVPMPPNFDPAKRYFKIRFTNEYFDSYEEYSERIDLYRQEQWVSKYSSGKAVNVTYEGALEVEAKFEAQLDDFPEELFGTLCRTIHHRVESNPQVLNHGFDALKRRLKHILPNYKLPPKMVIKEQIKRISERLPFHGSPVVCKTKYAEKYALRKTLPKTLQMRVDEYYERIERQKASTLSTPSKSDGKGDGTSGDSPSDGSKSKSRAPTEVEDLAVPSEFRRFDSDGAEILPPKLDGVWPNEIPEKSINDLVKVYQFLARFSKAINMSPFLMSDLEQCLMLGENSRLVDEIFISLCDAIRIDFVGHDFNPFGRKPLESLKLDALAKYLQKNVEPEFHPDKEALAALEDRDAFGALDAARKLKLMRLLCDEVMDTNRIRTAISDNLDALSMAAARKRGDEAQESQFYQEYHAELTEAKSKRVLMKDRPDFVKAAMSAIKNDEKEAAAAEQSSDPASASSTSATSSRKRAVSERAREMERRKQLEHAQAMQSRFDRSVEKTEEKIKAIETAYRTAKNNRRLERETRYALEKDRHSLRAKPVGSDRYFRRYYLVAGNESARMLVQTPILRDDDVESTLGSLGGSLLAPESDEKLPAIAEEEEENDSEKGNKRRKLNSGDKESSAASGKGSATKNGRDGSEVQTNGVHGVEALTPTSSQKATEPQENGVKKSSLPPQKIADVEVSPLKENLPKLAKEMANGVPPHKNGRLRNGVLPNGAAPLVSAFGDNKDHQKKASASATDAEGDVVMNGDSESETTTDKKVPPPTSSASADNSTDKKPADSTSSSAKPPVAPLTPSRSSLASPSLMMSPNRRWAMAGPGEFRRAVQTPKLGYDPTCDPTVRHWWSCFDTLEEYDELMESLNVKGVREKALHDALTLRREYFAESIIRQRKIFDRRLNPSGPPRRSSRTRWTRKKAKYTEVDEDGDPEVEIKYPAGIASAYTNELRLKDLAASKKGSGRRR